MEITFVRSDSVLENIRLVNVFTVFSLMDVLASLEPMSDRAYRVRIHTHTKCYHLSVANISLK